MKVIHVISGLETGGAERTLCTLAEQLAERGWEQEIVSLRGEGGFGSRLRDKGLPVHSLHLGRHGAGLGRALVTLRGDLRRFAPDVVQGWMYHGNMAAMLGAKLAGLEGRVAWNVRHSLSRLADEYWLTRQVIRLNRRLSGRAAAIIYNSEISRRHHERFGFAGERGVVIPNGFAATRTPPENEPAGSARQRLSIPDGAFVVGHVARRHPMKDHESFLRAAVRVARRRGDAWFLLIGRGVDADVGPLAGIVPADLRDRFVFTGERRDARELMHAMNVLVVSSAWGEAFPNVLGEAMARGVPCVSTDVGDSAQIVGDTGRVVPPADSDALAGAILEVATMAPETRASLGRQAQARIESRYGLETITAKYLDLYRRLEASA